MTTGADWLAPEWRIAAVGALMTTRAGGVSAGPYASMNVGVAVGDDHECVAANRARLAEATGAAPVFLRQLHGTRVVRVFPIHRPGTGGDFAWDGRRSEELPGRKSEDRRRAGSRFEGS